ncbi:MAG: hypothetical protein EOM17_12450 [Synergistales bacterium]|jgi:hypothetical protein|nr:hypothetical protein [Synergistales bacterium]
MAFESIQGDLDKIEELLSKGLSPQSIAKKLGYPKKYKTIQRYKRDVFDVQAAASEAWEEEKAKTTEERLEEGKVRIIDSLELLNLAKLRGWQLLDLNIGDPYKTAGDEQEKALSLGSCAIYWDLGTKIATQAIRQEQEIAGDDPESRKADALEGLGESELRELHKLLVARRDELGSEAD